jgi:uncharacterized protein (AIM24 family)
MKTFDEKVEVLSTAVYDNAKFQVIAINNLEGATSPVMAMNLYFAQQAGLRLRQVKITLNNSAVKTEAGALYYYKGNITSETKIGGVSGMLKKAVVGSVTQESAMKPVYRGTGEIMLEPSFKHYVFIELKGNSIVVDKAMFYASSDTVELGVYSQKNISSAMFGGEGFFQIKLSGHGIVVLESDVPSNELMLYNLQPGEELKVDGNFAIARTENVEFCVTKSDKSLLGSAMNGEGFLNTFKVSNNEPGKVWLAPTAPLYRKLEMRVPVGSNSSRNNME